MDTIELMMSCSAAQSSTTVISEYLDRHRPLESFSAADSRERNVRLDAASNSTRDMDCAQPPLPQLASSILCRYFAAGICRFGTLCRFSHDPILLETSAAANTIDNPIQPSADADEQITVPPPTQPPNSIISDRIVPTDPTSWINAPVFIPKYSSSTSTTQNSDLSGASLAANSEQDINTAKSYAQILSGNKAPSLSLTTDNSIKSTEALCPYIRGTPVVDGNNEVTMICPYGEYCEYKHGCLCDMCGQFCLHPTDLEQRKQHQSECIRQHEKDMELSFAIARSKDKSCGVCFEVITEKNGREQRFGILPNCNHIFCLGCIRKWRQAKQFDNNIIRACPECRVTSDFVCPSLYWVESKEDKDKLINDYKGALGKQNCKYFKQGSGKCPFGNKCFYKHALPNGSLVDVGVPQRQERRRLNENGETDVLQQLLLWNFLDARENIFIDDFVSLISDNSDSDLSDSDMFDVEY